MLENIVATLTAGGLVVLRTDTLYGILACAYNQDAVERIYDIKGRQSHKPFLNLVTDAAQLFDNAELFARHAERFLDRPTSIIVEAPSAPAYLTRGGTSLGYRLERGGLLRDVITHSGILVAPSANPEGLPPARTIEEARAYFGNTIDLYVDGGEVPEGTAPSRIIRLNTDGSVEQLR